MQTPNSHEFKNLITPRLLLRQLKAEDAPKLLLLRSNNQVNQYLDRPKTSTLHEVTEFIKKINLQVDKKASFYWAISLNDDDELIGAICYWNIDEENSSAELGYELHPDFQGKGLMQEALAAVITFGFQQLHFKTLLAFSSEANQKSIKILEKNNFKRDKKLEGEYFGKEISAGEIIYVLRATVI